MLIRNITPQLAERGKIKIGRKGPVKTSRTGTEFQPPQKLDHFVVTTLDRGQDGNYVPDPEAIRLWGDKPTSLPVRLLFDDIEGNFSSRYVAFVGKKQWCAGDGVQATRQTGAGPAKVECPCPRIAPDYQGEDRCKFNGALSVILDGMPGIGGVWKFRTTSYNSTVNLMSSLALIKRVTGGVLSNIPLNLVLHAKQATDPQGKQQTVYIVSLEYPGSVDELRAVGMQQLRQNLDHHIEVNRLESAVRRLLLPSPGGPLDGDDEDEIAEEFYPEQIDRDTGEVIEGKPATASRLDALEASISDPPPAPPPAGDVPAAGDVPHQPAGARPLASYAKTAAGWASYLNDVGAIVDETATAPDMRRLHQQHAADLGMIAQKSRDGTKSGQAQAILDHMILIMSPDLRGAG